MWPGMRACYLGMWLVLSVWRLSAQMLGVSAWVHSAAVDSRGFMYLAGDISRAQLPATPGVFQPNPPADCTVSPPYTCLHGFVAKVAPSGEALVWATYFGGNGRDSVRLLTVHSDGSIVIAGTTTSRNLLAAVAAYRSAPASLFVAKLSSDGRTLLSGTYFGGTAEDRVAALKLDSAGNVYLAGTAVSKDFPASSQHLRPVPGSGSVACIDGKQFVAKFNPPLTALLVSSLISSAWGASGHDLVVGQDGTLHVAGTLGRERDCQGRASVVRLTPDGSTVLGSAVVGGDVNSPSVGAHAMALGLDGVVYLAGDTRLWAAAAPTGTIWKLDASGRLTASQRIDGLVDSLSIGANGELVALGTSFPLRLAETPAATNLCLVPRDFDYIPYIVRLSADTLAIRYAGYLSPRRAWLAAPEQVVATKPYGMLAEFGVLSADAPPPGTVTCAANAASYDGSSIAPGEVMSLFGNQIGTRNPEPARYDANGNVTSELAGLRVLVDGLPSPLLYAAQSQINLVVPFVLPSVNAVRFEIQRDGNRMSTFKKVLTPWHPGLFTADGSGRGWLAALNQDGSVNGPQNPASPGSIVSIFATGLGAMTPQPVDGSRPSQPASTPLAVPRVSVNGQSATIEYIGNAPTLVQGVVQINIRLPNPLPQSESWADMLILFGDAPGLVSGARGALAVR